MGQLAAADMQLEHVALELRFEPAFLLWDRAGQLWTELAEAWPAAKLVRAEPVSTAFRINEGSEATVELQSTRLLSMHPVDHNEFCEHAKVLWMAVASHLKITVVQRLGCRFFYTKQYESNVDSARSFAELGLLTVPASVIRAEANEELILPEASFRRVDGSNGTRLAVRTEEKSTSMTPPLGIRGFPPIEKTNYQLAVDIDHYTTRSLQSENVFVDEWFRQALKVAERDMRRLLERTE